MLRPATYPLMNVFAQTRVWNLVIDVVACSAHYKSNATNLQNEFALEGVQHH
jgi:hypothetical protein